MINDEDSVNLNIDLDENISEISFTESDDLVTKLNKKVKLQKEQSKMLKQQKTMEVYKNKILKEEFDQMEKRYKLLQEENSKNLNEIDHLRKELKEYKDNSTAKKTKGKSYSE